MTRHLEQKCILPLSSPKVALDESEQSEPVDVAWLPFIGTLLC